MATIPDGKVEVIKFIQDMVQSDGRLLTPIDWHSWLKLLGLVVWFLGCTLLLARHPLIFAVPVFLLMGVLHYYFVVAIHEAIHRTLLSNGRINDIVGAVIGGFALANFDSVKRHHLSHHQLYGRDPDPDREEYVFDPPARHMAELIWRIFKRSFALTNLGEKIERNLWRRKAAPAAAVTAAREANALAVMAAAQIGVFLVYAAISVWWHYFVFWLAPMFVLSRFLSGLRMYGEHAGLALEAGVSNRDQIYAARTTVARSWQQNPLWLVEKFLLGPFNFNYHHEHHIMQHLPHHHLPKVHRALVAMGYYDRHLQSWSPSYLATLRRQMQPVAGLGPAPGFAE